MQNIERPINKGKGMRHPPQSYCRKIPLSCRIGFSGLVVTLALLAFGNLAIFQQFHWLYALLLAFSGAFLLYSQLGSKPIRQNDADPDTEPAAIVDIAAGLPDIVWQIDYSSRNVCALNRVSAGNHPAPRPEDCRLASLFPARVSRLYLEALITLQSQGEARTLEYVLGAPDGEQYHFEARLHALDAGSCLAIIREINHIKETEEALLNQQIFLQQIIDTSPCLIFVRDRHGRFLLVNRETQATLGHDLLVQSHLDLQGSDLPLTAGDTEALERGEPVRLMDSWTNSKGQHLWFDMTKLPIVRGNETYILTSAINISHLRASEPALTDNGNLIRALASALPLPFLLISQQQIQFANVAACTLLEKDAAALIGQPVQTLFQNWESVLAARAGTVQTSGSDRESISARIHEVASHHDQVYLLTLA